MINHKNLADSPPTVLSESDHYKYYSLGGNQHPVYCHHTLIVCIVKFYVELWKIGNHRNMNI